MGFGILFIGYFLILNIAYPHYTDAIAALIMLYALYKLSSINRPFKQAAVAALALTVVGFLELGINVYGTFAYIPSEEIIISVLGALRCAALLPTCTLMLRGMGEVAREVGLGKISAKCDRLYYATAFLYAVRILLEISAIWSFMDLRIMATLTVSMLVASVVITAMTLIEIYRCYMMIYIPGEERERKSSAFMEKFEKHQEAAALEYAEYKREQQKKRSEKRKKK